MRRRGFTLIEVLMSLAIFALAAVSLGAAYSNVLMSRLALKQDEQRLDDLARCRAALEELAQRHADETIAIVTHGLVLDSAYRAATGLALDAQRPVPLVNASLNWFAFDGSRWSAGAWGDAEHLGPDGVTIFGDRRI